MILTLDAEDVTLMNTSYTFQPTKKPAYKEPKTDTQLLVDTAKTYKNLDFTWRQQLLIRICFCCKLKDNQSKMFEKGKKQLYEEMDVIKLINQLRVAALMSEAYLKPHQTMMVEWLAKYRLSADEEESSEENVKNYVGKVFTTDDLGIQSDLIDQKELYSIKNPKFTEKVHPIADHRLVHEFDP